MYMALRGCAAGIEERLIMFHGKKEEDTVASREKRNQFIREQVRPQKKRHVVLWLKRLTVLVASACIFGAIAGGVIIFVENHFSKPEEEVELGRLASSLPETPALSEEPEPTATNGTVEGKEITLSRIDKISQRLAAVGAKLDVSLVGVKAKSGANDWLEGKANSQTVEYGLLVQETTNFYYILTTCNAVQGQGTVTVQLLDDTTVDGAVLGCDTRLNMAIVRMKKSQIEESILAQMAVAQLGNGIGMLEGTNVIAVGCPNGVLRSVVAGRITNDSVRASVTDGEVQLYCTDIPYAEHSNGVVVNIRGTVVGILTTDFTEKTGEMGLSFIKLSGVVPVMELLQKKKSAPHLGIEGTSLSVTVAKAHHLDVGAYVTEVHAGSPAYEGGMRVADVITKVDNTAISSMVDLYQELLKKKSGDTVVYSVSRRSGKKKIRKELKIKLG